MRRGTPAAKAFGNLLLLYRTDARLSQRQVGERIGAPAATVSQIEKGQRALKEPKLSIWASALEVNEDYLRKMWTDLQSEDDPPIVRRRTKSVKTKELETIILELKGSERDRVLGYIHAIIENRRLSDVK